MTYFLYKFLDRHSTKHKPLVSFYCCLSDGLSVTPSFPICGMKRNERNIINGRLLPLWITSIPNTFGTMARLRLSTIFLLMSPQKSWMISYTVCHLLLTGFLKWSNFPHESKENNWNCFSLFRRWIYILTWKSTFSYPTIVQLKYLNVLCAKWRRWD